VSKLKFEGFSGLQQARGLVWER